MSIELKAYLIAKGKVVRKQLEELSDEQLAMWADKLFDEGFETPGEHIQRVSGEFKAEIPPFSGVGYGI